MFSPLFFTKYAANTRRSHPASSANRVWDNFCILSCLNVKLHRHRHQPLQPRQAVSPYTPIKRGRNRVLLVSPTSGKRRSRLTCTVIPHPASSLQVPRALWLAEAFSFDCTFWDDREGGLTRQPVGPLDTTTTATVTSTNRVHSVSFDSQCCT